MSAFVGTTKKGFTLIELLVVVAIIALLIAILLPALGKARDIAKRSVCASNVRSMLQSMVVYASENNNVFPLTQGWWNGAGQPQYHAQTAFYGNTAHTGLSPNIDVLLSNVAPYGIYKSGENDKTVDANPAACLWLLLLKNQLGFKSLVCPSDPFTVTMPTLHDANGLYYANVQEPGQFSYSIAFPWAMVGDKVAAAAAAVQPWWRNPGDSSIPLVSDVALYQSSYPSGSPKDYNTPLHNGVGQNVGFADSHVEWCKTPSVGQNGDDIFYLGEDANGMPAKSGTGSYGSGSNIAIPTGYPSSPPYDVFMVPVRKASWAPTETGYGN